MRISYASSRVNSTCTSNSSLGIPRGLLEGFFLLFTVTGETPVLLLRQSNKIPRSWKMAHRGEFV
jgi:hypothetical protein